MNWLSRSRSLSTCIVLGCSIDSAKPTDAGTEASNACEAAGGRVVMVSGANLNRHCPAGDLSLEEIDAGSTPAGTPIPTSPNARCCIRSPDAGSRGTICVASGGVCGGVCGAEDPVALSKVEYNDCGDEAWCCAPIPDAAATD